MCFSICHTSFLAKRFAATMLPLSWRVSDEASSLRGSPLDIGDSVVVIDVMTEVECSRQ